MRIQPEAGFRYVLYGGGVPEMAERYLRGILRGVAGERTCEDLQRLVRSLQARRYRLKTLAKR